MNRLPDIDDVIARAEHDYREGCDRFFVNEEEYQCILSYAPTDSVHYLWGDDIRIFGMRVVRKKSLTWWFGAEYMLHAPQFSVLIGSSDDPSPREMVLCRTELPAVYGESLPCPCGEVIWELRRAMAAWAEAWKQWRAQVDSEQTTLAQWAAEVDALVAEVEQRGIADKEEPHG